MRTENTSQEEDTWGAIGIGAMIVFISLILVAAVASAVIIQTAEKLQQNAQNTGDQTSDELSGKLSVMQGYVDGNNDYVLYVRLAAGSSSIPAATISWQLYCGNAGGYEDSVGAGGFTAAQVQRQSVSAFGAGVSPMLVSNSYKILIDAQGVCNANLIAGQDAQLYIHVESGGTTFETLSVPAGAQTGSPVI